MKKNVIILFILITVFGCKKNDTDEQKQGEVFKGCLIKSSVTTNGNGIANENEQLTYDTEGRVIKSNYAFAGGGVGIITYQYTDNKISFSGSELPGYSGAKQYTWSGYYQLNGENRIVKDVYNGDESAYVYSSDGYLESINQADGKFVFSYSGGNLVKFEEISSSTQSYAETFTYSTELLSQAEFDLPKSEVTNSHLTKYFGKQSKNMLLRHYGSGNSGNYDNYSFKKNGGGNIITVVKSSVSGIYPATITETTNYTYNCVN